jgi:benzoyl-CoA 2,3-dioxygenase component A
MARRLQLYIDMQVCQACDRCEAQAVCKLRAITRIDRDEPPVIDGERCRDCRACIPACPHGAVKLLGQRLSKSNLV